MKKKRGRPKKKDAVAPPKSYKACSNNFAHIYRGSYHTASTCKKSRRSNVYNIEAAVQSLTNLGGVASRVTKDAAATLLATLGPNEKKCEKVSEIFSSEYLFGIQQDLNLRNKQTIVLAQDLRLVTVSRATFEKGY